MTDEYDAGSFTPTSVIYYDPPTIYTPEYVEPIQDYDKEMERYDDYRGKAKMLIFNHTIFNSERQEPLKERNGSEKDGIELKETFERFGFEVEIFRNKKKAEIFDELEKVPTGLKCIAVVVLSHGKNKQISADDEDYDEKKILEHFKNKPEFEGVPKLFIFQICRTNSSLDFHLRDKDVMVLHSTYIDEFSKRNTTDGAWFIQIMCKRLNIMEKENLLLDEMTFVMRDICVHHKGKQMPTISYNIRKHFFLTPIDKDESREPLAD